MSILFRGAFVALLTPFSLKGRVDKKALAQLVEWHIQEGTEGIVCCGATGEGILLSEAERKVVADVCVQTAAGRIPIVVGTGTAETKQSVRFTQEAQRVGAAGCLVITPYYSKPSQLGCLQHIRAVAEVGLPVIVYHNPGRTCFRFTLDSMRALSEMPGVAALKDSSGDLSFVRQVLQISTLPVLSGDDDLTCATLLAGGVGAISVIGNLVPRGWKKMIQLALEKNPQAEKWAALYTPLAQGNFLEANPQCVKYLASLMGKCRPVLRPPLGLPSLATQQALRQLLFALALPFSRSLQPKV